MREIRNVLLFFVLGSLTIFALQNGSPFVLSINFLGFKTIVLPLSLWVLAAMGAGLITAFVMGKLFQAGHFLSAKEMTGKRGTYAERTSARTDTVLQDNYPSEATGSRAPQDKYSQEKRASVTEEPDIDDDEFYEDWPEEDRKNPHRIYESNQAPKSTSWTGTVYSSNYREPEETEAVNPREETAKNEQEEPVTDADYRVIIPPPATSPPRSTPQDDWGEKVKKPKEDW